MASSMMVSSSCDGGVPSEKKILLVLWARLRHLRARERSGSIAQTVRMRKLKALVLSP